jgi:hypothetical protein
MKNTVIKSTLALLLALATGFGNASLVFAQGFSTYGPYPGTPTSWNGTVTPVQPYVPANLPNGVPVNTVYAPNYIGNGHTTSNYGDYRNPSTNYQIPAYTGSPLNYRPSTTPLGGSYSNNQYGGRGYNPMGLIIGGGLLGAGALAVGARGLSQRRGMGNPANAKSNYEKDLDESEKRRKKQEEKIQRELKQAHEADLKRRGIMPTSAQAPTTASNNQPQHLHQQHQNQPKIQNSENLEGDVVPQSATQKLDF